MNPDANTLGLYEDSAIYSVNHMVRLVPFHSQKEFRVGSLLLVLELDDDFDFISNTVRAVACVEILLLLLHMHVIQTFMKHFFSKTFYWD